MLKAKSRDLTAEITVKFPHLTTEICCYANTQYREKKRHIEALLFFEIILKFAKKQNMCWPRRISLAQILSKGLLCISHQLVDANTKSKKMVKRYVIPIMTRIKEQLIVPEHLSSTGFWCDERHVALYQSIILRDQAICHGLVGEPEIAEAQIHGALNLIRNNYGRGASQLHLYGEILLHLGYVYLQMNRINDCARFAVEAIEAKKRATDNESGLEKIERVIQSEILLTIAQGRL